MTAHVIRHCENACRQTSTKIAHELSSLCGVYHAAGSGETTWYGFAAEAVRLQREREPDRSFAEWKQYRPPSILRLPGVPRIRVWIAASWSRDLDGG